MPVQNLDVLTILGFVILAGVVVNNAILIVHQSLNFMRGEEDDEPLHPQEAIRRAVRSRVRPILMSALTSVGGMLPLVLMPGSGSELYRGLGAVVVGGLALSTGFTLILVPVVLSATGPARVGSCGRGATGRRLARAPSGPHRRAAGAVVYTGATDRYLDSGQPTDATACQPRPTATDTFWRSTPMPTTTPEHDARIAKMTFSSVYPHYVTKVEKKGRTREELHQVITWLTGFDEQQLQKYIDQPVTFEEFFQQATLNPNADLITGVICGYRVEDIENPLTRKARYLDKLVDELARGKKMEKILRAG